MSSSNPLTQRTPYLRVQRDFPQEAQPLSVEVNKSYVDVANAVNNRTVGIFPVKTPVVNGESWFVSGTRDKQQALRQVYPFTFTSSPFNIPHGITISQISGFVRIWGTFVDSGGVWYPLPFVSATAVANQVQIQVNSTNIVITVGAGAPVPVTGFVILEWLSNV